MSNVKPGAIIRVRLFEGIVESEDGSGRPSDEADGEASDTESFPLSRNNNNMAAALEEKHSSSEHDMSTLSEDSEGDDARTHKPGTSLQSQLADIASKTLQIGLDQLSLTRPRIQSLVSEPSRSSGISEDGGGCSGMEASGITTTGGSASAGGDSGQTAAADAGPAIEHTMTSHSELPIERMMSAHLRNEGPVSLHQGAVADEEVSVSAGGGDLDTRSQSNDTTAGASSKEEAAESNRSKRIKALERQCSYTTTCSSTSEASVVYSDDTAADDDAEFEALTTDAMDAMASWRNSRPGVTRMPSNLPIELNLRDDVIKNKTVLPGRYAVLDSDHLLYRSLPLSVFCCCLSFGKKSDVVIFRALEGTVIQFVNGLFSLLLWHLSCGVFFPSSPHYCYHH